MIGGVRMGGRKMITPPGLPSGISCQFIVLITVPDPGRRAVVELTISDGVWIAFSDRVSGMPPSLPTNKNYCYIVRFVFNSFQQPALPLRLLSSQKEGPKPRSCLTRGNTAT